MLKFSNFQTSKLRVTHVLSNVDYKLKVQMNEIKI